MVIPFLSYTVQHDFAINRKKMLSHFNYESTAMFLLCLGEKIDYEVTAISNYHIYLYVQFLSVGLFRKKLKCDQLMHITS